MSRSAAGSKFDRPDACRKAAGLNSQATMMRDAVRLVDLSTRRESRSIVLSLRMTDNDAAATDSLPRCNAEASLRMRPCLARASHFHRAKFIPKPGAGQQSIVAQIPAMTPSSDRRRKGK
jgi:hypothetical protein